MKLKSRAQTIKASIFALIGLGTVLTMTRNIVGLKLQVKRRLSHALMEAFVLAGLEVNMVAM